MSTKIPIYEETGLEHCWNGTDPQGNLGKYKNWECKGMLYTAVYRIWWRNSRIFNSAFFKSMIYLHGWSR